SSHATALWILVSILLLPRSPILAIPDELAGFHPLPFIGPQDIARDEDGTFWLTGFLDRSIHHFSEDWEALEPIPVPFASNQFPTGVTFNSRDKTLFVCDIQGAAIIELERDGTPTGRQIPLELLPIVNRLGFPSVRSLAYYAQGDDGNGSIFLVE